MKLQPIAFLSYVRFDDKHDEGRITKFRERLSQEVRMQTGEEFPIFQDRNDIRWGQNWKERIEESVDGSTFLIAILTPSFFRSKYCREETERFLEREKRLNRNDLILPVYYVDCPLLNDEAKRATDRLAQILSSRQAINWRELRFKSTNSPKMRKSLEGLAIQIRDALERVLPTIESGQETAASGSESRVPESLAVVETAVATPKAEPRTRTVDAMLRGDHASISEAIKTAAPGERILVRPGLYQEGLVMDKQLEIIGDGVAGDVVVQATGAAALLFKTTMGQVTNLTLRQMGGEGKWYAVDIAQGRLELEKCDISSQSLSCVAIHAGADPRLRENSVHGGKQNGVFVYENGQGTLEDNDIFGNSLAGVEIKTGGNPTLRRNKLHDGKASGVFVHDNGQGTLEDNDIFANGLAGVAIKTGGNPTLRRNKVHDGKASGVFVYDNGQGTLEDNDIFGNAFSGVEIKTGGNPTLRRNKVHDGKSAGVYVQENGQGTLEDNDIFANSNAGVLIRTGGNQTLRRNRISKNVYEAIWIYDKGGGTFEDNDLRDNQRGAWDIARGCKSKVKRVRNVE